MLVKNLATAKFLSFDTSCFKKPKFKGLSFFRFSICSLCNTNVQFLAIITDLKLILLKHQNLQFHLSLASIVLPSSNGIPCRDVCQSEHFLAFLKLSTLVPPSFSAHPKAFIEQSLL